MKSDEKTWLDICRKRDIGCSNVCCGFIVVYVVCSTVTIGLLAGLNLYNYECPKKYLSVYDGDCLTSFGYYVSYIVLNNTKSCPINTYDSIICDDCMAIPTIDVPAVCRNSIRTSYNAISIGLLLFLCIQCIIIIGYYLCLAIMVTYKKYSIAKQSSLSDKIANNVVKMMSTDTY